MTLNDAILTVVAALWYLPFSRFLEVSYVSSLCFHPIKVRLSTGVSSRSTSTSHPSKLSLSHRIDDDGLVEPEKAKCTVRTVRQLRWSWGVRVW